MEAYFAAAPEVEFPDGWCSVATIPVAWIETKHELLAEYTSECSNPAVGEINPQWDTYAALEQAGVLTAYAVYADGAMVGFSAVLHHVLPHYGALVAIVESLFVRKAYRKKGAGIKLMRAIESAARLKGYKSIVYTAPAGGQLEALLEKRHPRTGSVYCVPLG